MNSCHKEYLLYLFGELNEYYSEKLPDSNFWKNNDYGIVLELEATNLYVHHGIWTIFSKFFSLEYIETKEAMNSILIEHLKLGGIYQLQLIRRRSWYWRYNNI